MIAEILVIVLAIAVAAVLFFLFRKAAILILNAVTGLLVLYLVNLFQLMGYAGAPDISITPATVIICAFGGVLGAAVLILLSLAGMPV